MIRIDTRILLRCYPLDDREPAGAVTRTAIESLGLPDNSFAYWFDFSDDCGIRSP